MLTLLSFPFRGSSRSGLARHCVRGLEHIVYFQHYIMIDVHSRTILMAAISSKRTSLYAERGKKEKKSCPTAKETLIQKGSKNSGFQFQTAS
jgi:hypothetical protein